MKQASRGRKKDTAAHSAAQREQPAPQPLQPRRELFVVLMLVLAVWMIALAALYLLTIDGVR